MARFMAVVDAPGNTEDEFRDTLGSMRRWRFDKRGWVVKAFCNGRSGKIYLDAEAPSRERLDGWLRERGWQSERIDEIDLIFEEGLLFPLGAAAG